MSPPSSTPHGPTLLVVGGYGSKKEGSGNLDTVEWKSNSNSSVGKFPIKIRGAFGAILKGKPYVCGGKDGSNTKGGKEGGKTYRNGTLPDRSEVVKAFTP